MSLLVKLFGTYCILANVHTQLSSGNIDIFFNEPSSLSLDFEVLKERN